VDFELAPGPVVPLAEELKASRLFHKLLNPLGQVGSLGIGGRSHCRGFSQEGQSLKAGRLLKFVIKGRAESACGLGSAVILGGQYEPKVSQALFQNLFREKVASEP
jgi:hypothetical protein